MLLEYMVKKDKEEKTEESFEKSLQPFIEKETPEEELEKQNTLEGLSTEVAMRKVWEESVGAEKNKRYDEKVKELMLPKEEGENVEESRKIEEFVEEKLDVEIEKHEEDHTNVNVSETPVNVEVEKSEVVEGFGEKEAEKLERNEQKQEAILHKKDMRPIISKLLFAAIGALPITLVAYFFVADLIVLGAQSVPYLGGYLGTFVQFTLAGIPLFYVIIFVIAFAALTSIKNPKRAIIAGGLTALAIFLVSFFINLIGLDVITEYFSQLIANFGS